VILMDPANIIFLECHRTVRSLVNSIKGDVICPQEAKMGHVSPRFLLSILGLALSHYVFLAANYASGGILICWHETMRGLALHFGHWWINSLFQFSLTPHIHMDSLDG
jgi:hypothetical protein